jgi:hypothetical protein
MDYKTFARVNKNNQVIHITPVSIWRVLNEYDQVDFRLSNDYLKQTIPDSENDIWLEVNDVPGKRCAIGYTYDENFKAFIPPKLFNSWILNTESFEWEPPTPKPELNFTVEPFYDFIWNEESLSWEQVF